MRGHEQLQVTSANRKCDWEEIVTAGTASRNAIDTVAPVPTIHHRLRDRGAAAQCNVPTNPLSCKVGTNVVETIRAPTCCLIQILFQVSSQHLSCAGRQRGGA